MNSEYLTWNYRQQPDLDELAAALARLTDGRLRLYQVDTGSQENAIVLATVPLTELEVDDIHLAHLYGDDNL